MAYICPVADHGSEHWFVAKVASILAKIRAKTVGRVTGLEDVPRVHYRCFRCDLRAGTGTGTIGNP